MALNDEEAEIIRQFLKSRSEALFRMLYRSHTPYLYRVALRLCDGNVEAAEDLTQETWERAVAKLHGFKLQSALRSWLIGILVNCSRERSARRNHEELTEAQTELLMSSAQNIEQTLDLRTALSKLPVGYRSVLVLHDFEGYKHHEIGTMLGITEGTSKSQLFNARNVIRKLIGSTT